MNTPTKSEPPIDFIVETDKARGVTYYTPVSHAAFNWSYGVTYDWLYGEPECLIKNRSPGMGDAPRFGRSFMFKSDNPRAGKLRGYLKGLDFNVVVRLIT